MENLTPTKRELSLEHQLEKEENKLYPDSSRKEKKGKKGRKDKKTKKKRSALKIIITIIISLILIGIIALASVVTWATWGMDFSFVDSFDRTGLELSSLVYYTDANGNLVPYEQLIADENRIWADYEDIPQHMKNALVAIEDERFFKHHGMDFKRTTGAVLNMATKGDSNYGGSTITQQLVKNITSDSERSVARKIREIFRAVVLEFAKSKEEILELYMNSIYLGHGANGVQAAAHAYFGKEVKDLNLVECVAIAGITQHPSTLDPIVNPEGNAKKRKMVLDKMLEFKYITQEEYNSAVNAELVINTDEGSEEHAQSYFVDHLFEELLNDLMVAKGYSRQYATTLIYNGGLKIISTIDPAVQNVLDDVYVNGNGFPSFYGEAPQSAIVVSDPTTGQIKGLVGGTGVKKGARVLNRATQTFRQPGSTIKPLASYGPALDTGVINMATSISNGPINIDGWKPKNANGKFSSAVSVQAAVANSYNMPAIRVLQAVTLDTSYEYMTKKLHFNLVDSYVDSDGIDHTDKGFAPLALGGLTEGVSVLSMNAAYSTFANKGEYIEPSSYTKVYDSNGEILLDKTPARNQAFSEETAYLMSQLLKGVVTYGTAGGYSIPRMETCGKTGSTDTNKDRWFIGYTPYYCASVWVGYDQQRYISYGGNNPALTAWSAVMKRIHEDLPERSFEQPEYVKSVYACYNTNQYASSRCRGTTVLSNTKLMSGYCDGVHRALGTPPPSDWKDEKDKDKKEEEEEEEEKTPTEEQTPSEGNPPTQDQIPPEGDSPIQDQIPSEGEQLPPTDTTPSVENTEPPVTDPVPPVVETEPPVVDTAPSVSEPAISEPAASEPSTSESAETSAPAETTTDTSSTDVIG